MNMAQDIVCNTEIIVNLIRRFFMYAIKAVYDGTNFKPKEPIPVHEEYEVIIMFTTPLKSLETPPKRFSKTEKDVITNTFFGVLPSDIDLTKARDERLR
jgi:predicted DNA-binding antitoxin AbrB/MazE fold protein